MLNGNFKRYSPSELSTIYTTKYQTYNIIVREKSVNSVVSICLDLGNQYNKDS